jgi:hypothetical protein
MRGSELSISVVKWSEGLSKKMSTIIRKYIDYMKLAVYMVVCCIKLFVVSNCLLYHYVCCIILLFVSYCFLYHTVCCIILLVVSYCFILFCF